MKEIPLITYISCIISRLVYFDNRSFILRYNKITSENILSSRFKDIQKINSKEIFKPKISASSIINIDKKVNNINYSRNIDTSVDIPNEDNKSKCTHVKYMIISTSNYSSVFLIADKRLNCIFVGFRGTSSPKSGMSYTKMSSIIPYVTCDDNGDNNGYVLGIFKITGEIFYTINEGIKFLKKDFLRAEPKIVTTGHSLGGGCAQIFSYFWSQIKKNPICCVTFAAPRVMNGPLISKYINLMREKYILYQRVVTEGDLLTELPPVLSDNYSIIEKIKLNNISGIPEKIDDEIISYYHVNDYNSNLDNHFLLCKNYKITKKINCNLKKMDLKMYKNTKTIKKKVKRATKSVKINHGNYLGVNFDKAAQGLEKRNKEISRDRRSNTICRIIVGCDNYLSRVSFFNLNNVKNYESNILYNITNKMYKLLLTDYLHQDVYMNTRIFNTIVREGEQIVDEFNPLTTKKYININVSLKGNPKKSLVCL